MKKQGDEYILSKQEMEDMSYFIDQALDSQWDCHSSHYISYCSWEDGKKKMNPQMYEMMKTIDSLKYE